MSAPDAELSINLATIRRAEFSAALAACRDAGARGVGVWWADVQARGAGEAGTLVRAAGLRATSLNGVRIFDPACSRNGGDADRVLRDAIADTAALGADVLVLLCGPCPEHDLALGRERLAEVLASVVPDAEAHGVMLGLEPLHPYFAGERTILTTLAEANALAADFPSEVVGVIADAYHVWWDPDLDKELRRAGGRLVGFHVSDWLPGTRDVLNGRAMIGDGIIPLRTLYETVRRCGYRGPIDVEIFNRQLWERPPAEVLDLVVRRFAAVFGDVGRNGE
jgi:sugar phosphate isomerase/epimerase